MKGIISLTTIAVVVTSVQADSPQVPVVCAAVRSEDMKVQVVSDNEVLTHFEKPAAIAHGCFESGLHTTGWGVLRVVTNPAYPDDLQATAAGVVEGYLTASEIYPTYLNMAKTTFKGSMDPPKAIKTFLDDQEEWVKKSIASDKGETVLWKQAKLLFAQYAGLEMGYNQNPKVKKIPHTAFQLLNAVGDLIDLMPALAPKEYGVDWNTLSVLEAQRAHTDLGHCSALIKVTGNYSDILYGHSSWYSYGLMNRVYKYYTLNYSPESGTKASTVSFSSYPGFLESLDDFYQTSANLVMVQTTNGILDHSVYEGKITPKSLLAWQRVRIANSVATTGPEWRDMFSKHASGTYANQYMVLNLNLFNPGSPLVDNLLWVIEEMPGKIVSADQTAYLRQGYWPSYNVPFYPEISEASGYKAMTLRLKNFYFTHELAPRAQIFRRDQGTVQGLGGLKRILRENKYTTDPYSFNEQTKEQDPMYAICSRGDLATGASKRPGGCYDTKVSSFRFRGGSRRLRASIINGPTVSGGELPPFQWDKVDFPSPAFHVGLPNEYNFSFMDVQMKHKRKPLVESELE